LFRNIIYFIEVLCHITFGLKSMFLLFKKKGFHVHLKCEKPYLILCYFGINNMIYICVLFLTRHNRTDRGGKRTTI